MIDQKQEKNNFYYWLDEYRALFCFLLMSVILVVGYFYWLNISVDKYRDSRVLLSSLSHQLKQADLELSASSNFAGKIYSVSEREKKIMEMALPSQFNQASILEQITVLANKSGFSVASLELSDNNGKNSNGGNLENLGKVSIRIKLSGGGYQELKQFIALCEQSIMPLNVVAFNFNSQSSIYDLSLLAYYFKYQQIALTQ